MVWSNLTTLFTFITSITTSSTDFGVLVYVIGSPNPSIDDPNSCTILLPSSNSNGNPSANSSLLGGTYRSIGLNFAKTSCVTILSICNSIACRPSCVYCCCCKCWKYFGLVMVSIQSSHTSPSKSKCSSPFRNLIPWSLLTPWHYSHNCFSCGNVIYGISYFYPLDCLSCGDVICGTATIHLTT